MIGITAIGLHHPKYSSNVGSVLRSAGCYEADMVAVSGARYKRSCTDTQKAHIYIPLLTCENLRDVIPFDCIPVAVDLVDGAKPLPAYHHPKSAFYIFGPEDSTLGESILSWCRDRIYVPTRYCLNLATAVSTVLYDRRAKNQQYGELHRERKSVI